MYKCSTLSVIWPLSYLSTIDLLRNPLSSLTWYPLLLLYQIEKLVCLGDVREPLRGDHS